MTNYMRVASIIVGPAGEEGEELTGHRLAFSVKKTTKSSANTMTVHVYNAAPTTRALLETTDNRVILTAGYQGNTRQVAVGNITRAATSYQPPSRITSVTCGDGVKSLASARVSLSYDGAVTASQIVSDIASSLDVEMKETTADLSGKFSSGWAFVGPARDAMSAIAGKFGLDWSIQNEEMQITAARGVNTSDAILITSDTGLIGIPEPLDADRDNLPTDTEGNGLKVRTLMNPLYEPGGLVVLTSRDYDSAQFRIRTVEHSGDTYGAAWQSTLEIIEYAG